MSDQDNTAVVDRGDTLAAGAPEIDPNPLEDDKVVPEEKGAAPTEEETEDEDSDEGKKKRNSPIPLARHKEILDKARKETERLAAEIAQLKSGAQAKQITEQLDATETKIVTMEAEYNKLLADGEIDKATAKMTEIRRLERSVNDQKAAAQSELAEARAVERVRYDVTVERLEAAYPAINPEHADFNEEKVREVLDLKEAYELKGLSPSAALQKAVGYVIPATTAKQESATEVKARVAADDVAKARKEEATKRAIDAAQKTPASLAKAGLNSDVKGGVLSAQKVAEFTQDRFAEVDDATLAQLRGDEL